MDPEKIEAFYTHGMLGDSDAQTLRSQAKTDKGKCNQGLEGRIVAFEELGAFVCVRRDSLDRAGDGVGAMFETIDEQVETTEGGRPTISKRLARFAGIAVVLVVFFAGLYFAIVSFE